MKKLEFVWNALIGNDNKLKQKEKMNTYSPTTTCFSNEWNKNILFNFNIFLYLEYILFGGMMPPSHTLQTMSSL